MRRRNYFEVTRQQQYKHRKILLHKLAEANHYAESIGLKIDSILLNRIDEKENSPKVVVQDQVNETINEKDIVFKCLMAKDITNLSNRKYKIIRSHFNFIYMPGLNRVLDLQKKLNLFFKTKRNKYGSYCDAFQKINFVCRKHLEQALIVEDDVIIIKLSSDGTQITKSYVHLTFTIINSNKNEILYLVIN